MGNPLSGLLQKIGFGKRAEGVPSPTGGEAPLPSHIADGTAYLSPKDRGIPGAITIPSSPETPRAPISPEGLTSAAPEQQMPQNPSAENKG